MKINQYNQMMKSLTKPGTPEQRKKLEEKIKKEKELRIAKTREKYGLPKTPVKITDPLTKNLINSHNLYDESESSHYVVDHSTNELKTDQQIKEEIKYQELKAKLDKYKYVHGENKPKRTLKNTIVYDGSKDEHKPFVKKPISQPQKSQQPIPRLPQDYEIYRPEKNQKTLEEHLAETKPKVESGINNEFVSEQLAIQKNIDWVLGGNRKIRKNNKKDNDNDNNDGGLYD